ncbi:ankyrin repeat and sterile alpha motif domain-containing protein 1B isoform X1, partial [Lates japonicus]
QVDPPRGWATLDRPPSYSSGQNRDVPDLRGIQTVGVSKDSSSGTGYEERACTLGRMRSMPRSVLDLQLSKSLSKSDSNLVAVSPIQEEHSWGSGSRGQGPGSPSPGEGASLGGRLERTPSFTAEWEEIDKIMSSIGAGIGSGLDIKEDTSAAIDGGCVIVEEWYRLLKSMGGPFDSHFARHDMMWQCQLSQPTATYRGRLLPHQRLPLHPQVPAPLQFRNSGSLHRLVQYENHLLAKWI